MKWRKKSQTLFLPRSLVSAKNNVENSSQIISYAKCAVVSLVVHENLQSVMFFISFAMEDNCVYTSIPLELRQNCIAKADCFEVFSGSFSAESVIDF